MNELARISLFFILVLSGVGLRLLFRDLPNFAPVAALSLFAGYFFRHIGMAILVPISVMAITNACLGGYPSWAVLLSVYGCLTVPALLGQRFLATGDHRRVASITAVMGWSLASSLLFFFVTNYASWVQWYPPTWSGFVDCYVAAIPFFRYTLAGDVFFSALFFGGHAVAVHLLPAGERRLRPLEGERFGRHLPA